MKRMMKRGTIMFRWAYLGCGGIAHTTAKELVKIPDQKIVAVWNRTKSKAEEFAKRYGGKVYDSVEELLDSPEVDGVYIALTADQHAKYMELCIRHHKPVLCEKPFTVNAKEAKRIFELAQKENVYVAEAMWTWHNKTAKTVKKWLKEGMIGKVNSVECAYAFPMLKFSRNPRILDPMKAGGALMDIGVYGIRYVYELFGMPKAVQCKGELKNGCDIGEEIRMIYPEFYVDLQISMVKKVGEYFHICGTEGKIQVPMFHMAKKAKLESKEAKRVKDNSSLYGVQFSNTVKEIQEGLRTSRIISPKSTVEVMMLLDECRKQMGVEFPMEKEKEDRKLNTRIKTISHLGFNCKNLQKTMDFYCNILGATEKFYLTYGDIADDKVKESKEKGEPIPKYVNQLRKFNDRKWSVYLQWTENSFIELFDQLGAFRKRIPKGHDLNYTHFSLEVENIRDFRQMIIERGGSEYLDTEISRGMEYTWQMWMHDPEGNKFEIMEYSPESYQLIGRHSRDGVTE